MLLQDLKELKTGWRELRNFGLLVGGVFLGLGLWALLKHKPWHLWLIAPGALLFILGLVAPTILRLVYIAWMSLALVMGFVVSHVILGVFFFCVITPVGLVARIIGRRDFLRLKLDPKAESYWIKRPAPEGGPERYERQF